MKALAFFFAIFVALASGLWAETVSEKPLSEWLVDDSIARDIAELVAKQRPGCVEAKLKISETGSVRMHEGRAERLLLPARLLCVQNPDAAFKAFFELFEEGFEEEEEAPLKVDCFVARLRELEPSAAILRGIDARVAAADECEEEFAFVTGICINLNDSCGSRCSPEIQKLVAKLMIVKRKAELSAAVKAAERQQFVPAFQRIFQLLLDCAVDKLLAQKSA